MIEVQVASMMTIKGNQQRYGIVTEEHRTNKKLKKFVKSRGRPFKYVVIVLVLKFER